MPVQVAGMDRADSASAKHGELDHAPHSGTAVLGVSPPVIGRFPAVTENAVRETGTPARSRTGESSLSGTCPEVLINIAKPENPFRKVEEAEVVHFLGRDIAMVMPGLLRRVIDMAEVRVFAGPA